MNSPDQRSTFNLNPPQRSPGTANAIFTIKSLSWPELVFEYHPATKRVYKIDTSKVINKGTTTGHEAVLIGEAIESANQAKAVAGAWIDGFKEGQKPENRLKIIGG